MKKKKLLNKDWVTIEFPVRPLQITFERELFEQDNEKDFTEQSCKESAFEIIGEMGHRELGEYVMDQFTEEYEPKITAGYNDDIEGDLKEIMDSKTKAAEAITLGALPKIECEQPILLEREVVYALKPIGELKKAIAEKKK